MSKNTEKFFYFLTYLAQGPSFLNPKSYSIMHQLHHEHSDTKEDPHSPYFYKNIWSMMLKTYKTYREFMIIDPKLVSHKVIHHYPEWKIVDQFARSKINILFWGVIYTSIYYYFTNIYFILICVPIHCFMGPFQGAIVNWCGHKIGYRNFPLEDKSRNTFFQDFFLMGELYQNNHHQDKMRSNFAVKWFEVDPTYLMMIILQKIHVIKIKTKV